MAVPATHNKSGSPFFRAYPEDLQQYGIPEDTFFGFLDHINRAMVASPPLQILGLAGSLVSFVPLHTAQVVGGAVNAASNIATVAMSKSKTEYLLRQANRELFGPRGLDVQIARLDSVAKLSGMPVLDEKGRLNKRTQILAALNEEESARNGQSLTTHQRRLRALQPWIAPLKVEFIPDIEEATNMWSRIHTGASERQRRKEEKKLLKDRYEAHHEWRKENVKAKKEFEKEMGKLVGRRVFCRALRYPIVVGARRHVHNAALLDSHGLE